MPLSEALGNDSRRHCHHQQNWNGEGKGPLQYLAEFQTFRVGAVVNTAWIAGENRDVKPEIVKPLIPGEPDAGARHGDHQAVEKRDPDHDECKIRSDLYDADRLTDLNQRITEQAKSPRRSGQHRQFHLLARDQELRVNRLDQNKVEIARADHLAEVRTVRHEQSFDDRIDQESCRHEGVVLRMSPVADRFDVAVNNFEQRNLGADPESSRDDCDEEIPAKHHLANERVSEERRPDARVVCLS